VVREDDYFNIDLVDFHTRGGKLITKKVNCVLDIRDFKQRAGFAWLLIAANPQLSLREIQSALEAVGKQHERSASWIGRRRWMFHDPSKPGAPKNRDRRDEQVLAFIETHPKMSSRQIAGFLQKKGIARSATWIRQHRVLSAAH
jgi:hypothetical protein